MVTDLHPLINEDAIKFVKNLLINLVYVISKPPNINIQSNENGLKQIIERIVQISQIPNLDAEVSKDILEMWTE